jgi:hypothetical protein
MSTFSSLFFYNSIKFMGLSHVWLWNFGLERIEDENKDLQGFKEKYHEADKKLAVSLEKLGGDPSVRSWIG